MFIELPVQGDMMLHRHGLYPYVTGPDPFRESRSADDLNAMYIHFITYLQIATSILALTPTP